MTFSKKEAPANFREIAEGHSVHAVRKMTGAHSDTIKRWFSEHGMQPGVGAKKPRCDPGERFNVLALTMTNAALAAYFKMDIKTIMKIRRERGIVRIENAEPAQLTAAEQEQRAIVRRKVTANKKGPQPAPDSGRDDSPVGFAVEYMRSGSRGWNISRCDADGAFNPRGDHYRAGTMPVKTADEMMQWARDKGWKLVDIFSIAA